MSEHHVAGAGRERAVEELFEGRPESLRLFRLVREYMESLGPVRVSATGTQVSFGARRKFAWVWLPQMWVGKRREGGITLTFALDRRVEHTSIAEAVEPRPGRWTHHVVIDSTEDFDESVRGWLREAYELGK